MDRDKLRVQDLRNQDEIKAVSNCLVLLQDTPEILADFYIDLDKDKHRKWHIYRQEFSKIRMDKVKGRSVPIRNRHGQGKILYGSAAGLRKDAPLYIPMLKLTGLTKIEKVKKIIGADCSNEIKKELIEEVMKCRI